MPRRLLVILLARLGVSPASLASPGSARRAAPCGFAIEAEALARLADVEHPRRPHKDRLA